MENDHLHHDFYNDALALMADGNIAASTRIKYNRAWSAYSLWIETKYGRDASNIHFESSQDVVRYIQLIPAI